MPNRASADFAVVVCTRDRPQHLTRTVDALLAQEPSQFDILVVDQSADPGPLPDRGSRLRVHRDTGRGLSRARNIALRETEAPWLVFVDDDCLPQAGWAAAMGSALNRHPDVGVVSGAVIAHDRPAGDYLDVTTFAVGDPPRRRRGRWAHPSRIGFGVCFAVRRSVAEQLGGWDERLGPGVRDFPAADDMDFNYRFLRAGGVGYVTPVPRAAHDQWRATAELPGLYGGYATAWTGFACKHMRTGDVRGGLWLLSSAVVDVVHMAASALRHRSRLRLAVAFAQARGVATGLRRGLGRSW